MALVERASELDRVRALVAAAARGDGGAFVTVAGEPGAGKSALLREALDGVDASWGWCEPGLTPRPWGPFRDAIGAGLLGPAAAVTDPTELVLEALAARPVVLVIEDGHWIDDASARLLRFLGRRIAATPSVVLVTFRDNLDPEHPLRQVLGDLATSPACTRIELEPLTEAGVAQLLEDSGRDAAEAHRVTGGNPFLVSALRDSPGEEVSATVRDLAWSWVRRLEPEHVEVLKSLVVLPGRIERDAVPGPPVALDALVRQGLLRTDGVHLQFRHELVRRALDRDLAPQERARAHDAAYRRLLARAGAEPSELAFHALRAGLVAQALQHERAAGERAVASGAHRQAVDHFRRAVDLAEGRAEVDDVVRLCVALATEEYVVGNDADARRYAAKASALADRDRDPYLFAETLMTRSRVSASEGDCLRFAERGVAVLEELGGVAFAAAAAHLASGLMVAREMDRAEVWARRALDLVEEDEHPAIAVNALQALGSTLTLTGRDDACAHLRRAVELGRRTGVDRELGVAHCNLVSAAGEARLYDVVRDAAEPALEFFAAHDLDSLGGYTRAWLGRCAFEQGRWPEAGRWVDEVLDSPLVSSEITVITALCVRGRILARRGDPGVAAALEKARELAWTTEAIQRIGPVAVARAEAAWLAGETHDRGDLEAALALAEQRTVPGYAEELRFWLRRTEGGPAPDDAGAAGETWARLGCPYEAADAWSESDDEDLLRRALVEIDALGAAPLRARVVRRLRELGVRSIPRGPRSAAQEDQWGLTAREQEVLGWLVQGCTDAEIAVGLHLSAKTVGHHVSAILRKTGTASRRDLRAAER